MTYQAVVDWLFQQVPNYQQQGNTAYKPGLERVESLLDLLDNPHQKIKTIHVAGTNGKGSVSHILAAIFQAHGLKVGLFTSPHIKDFRERIKINGELVSEEFVIDFCQNNDKHFSTIGASFFEITAAMAFEAFAENQCDIAIIETGLGGRLDATNVITPILSVITHIGIDHTAFLGDTLPEIAMEKAGIIKPSVPVVVAERKSELQILFKEVALANNSEIYLTANEPMLSVETDLLGYYQQINIQTALKAISVLKKEWLLQTETTHKALLNVALTTSFKGRMQRLSNKPLIILDAAHNKDGIVNLLKEVKAFQFNQLHIIYGASNDKDWEAIIDILPIEGNYFFTEFDSKRSVKSQEFENKLKKSNLAYKVFQTPEKALSQCKSVADINDLILICGSFYLMEKIIE